jgi:hypothetical protein
MAFRSELLLDGRLDNRLPVFYNLTMPVGVRAPNRRDDVLLVQYFLLEIYKNPAAHTPPLIRPKGNLVVDGKFGPITRNWILKFQLDVRDRGKSVYPDSRVDRARGAESSITHTVYTIIHMNASFKKLRPDDFEHLEAAPDVPPELAAALAVN